MEIIIKENYEQMSKEAAFFVKKRILKNPNLVLGLATGATPLGLYKELVRMHQKEGLNFSEVTTFNLDEYFGLEPSQPQSYYFYMWENFFKHINIKKENVFIPEGITKDTASYCQWYENKIKGRGGIDLQVLGIGRNGHIGFNEPGAGFESRTRLVFLDRTTVEDNSKFFDNIEAVPKKAITVGLETIMEAKECLLLCSGAGKSAILYKALKGPVSIEVPASILQKHSKLTVMVDKESCPLVKLD